MKTVLRTIITIAMAVLLCVSAFAHPGRTDSHGGHKDNQNVSGLGKYHYHCDGYPAHLHEDGVCPYDIIETETSSEHGYYINGEWHGLILPKGTETTKRSGEIKLKEEPKEESEDASVGEKVLDTIAFVFSLVLLIFVFLATIVSPIVGLIYFACVGIKKAINKRKEKKDQH